MLFLKFWEDTLFTVINQSRIKVTFGQLSFQTNKTTAMVKNNKKSLEIDILEKI